MHWVACPDILMPSRKVWIACNFLSLRSPFVFKILGSWESSLIKHPVIIKIFRWISWSFKTVLLIEENTEQKTIELTSFAWADLQLFDSVTLFNRNLSAVSGRVSLKATDTTLVVGFRKFFEDWTHHGIILCFTCYCYRRHWGLLMRRKGSCHVDFIVKALIHFIDSNHIPSIILFITFPRIWIIKIFWVSSAPCSQLTGIMQRSQLSGCFYQLNDLLHLTFWMLTQLGAHRSKGLLQSFC